MSQRPSIHDILLAPMFLLALLASVLVCTLVGTLTYSFIDHEAEDLGIALAEASARISLSGPDDNSLEKVLRAITGRPDVKRAAWFDTQSLANRVGTSPRNELTAAVLPRELHELASNVFRNGESRCVFDHSAQLVDCIAVENPVNTSPSRQKRGIWVELDLHSSRVAAAHVARWQLGVLFALAGLLIASLWWIVRRHLIDPISSLKVAAASHNPASSLDSIAHSLPHELATLATTLSGIALERDQSLVGQRESIERFNLAVEGAEQVIWDADLNTGDLYFSPRMASILKVEVDALPKTFQEYRAYIVEADREEVSQAMRRYFRTRDPYYVEYRVQRADGSHRWLASRARAIWNDQDRATRMAGSTSDVTKQKQADIALAALSHRYRSLCNHLPGVVFNFVVPREGQAKLEVHGETKFEWFGLPRDAGPQDLAHYLSRVHADDIGALLEYIDRVVAHPQPWYQEFRLILERGKEVWIEGRSTPQKQANGDVIFTGVMIDITARKIAEQQLVDKRQLLLAVLEKARCVIFRALPDEHWTILYINGPTEDICGYSADEFMGENSLKFLALCNPTDLQLADQKARGAIIRREPFDVQYRMRHPSGEERWVEVRGAAKYGAEGAVEYLDLLLFDIHVTKMAEIENETHKRRLDLALRGGDLGTWEWNLIDDTLSMNAKCAEIWCLSDSLTEYTTAQTLPLVHPDDLERLKNALNACLQGFTTQYTAEFRVRDPNGGWRWIYDRGQVVSFNIRGGAVFMAGTNMDITARKIAEQRSIESNTVLTTVIDLLPQRVFWKSKSGKYLGANKAFCEEFNLQSVTGLTVYDLGLPVEIARLFEAADRDLIESGGEIRDKVVPSRNTPSVPEWISYSKAPMRNTSGEITGFVGTYLDVTTFKTTEQELILARDAAEVANRAKTDFLATMSHEIRTPLNGTLGCLQLLQDTTLDSDQQELTATALNCGKVLLAQLNDILDFSKIENGDVEFNAYSFDARDLCLEALELIAPRASARDISVDLEWSHRAPEILRSDPQRVRQILNNLLSNALKFTERGSIRLEVNLEAGSMLRFEVRDTGIGVPADAQERIFEKFAQADASTTRRYGGSGLGLTICRRLVRALGGEIGVESVSGAGATFWFTLPTNIEGERHDTAPHSLRSDKPALLEVDS